MRRLCAARGRGPPDVLGACNTLASLLHDAGRLEEAEPLYREALAPYSGPGSDLAAEADAAEALFGRGAFVGNDEFVCSQVQRRAAAATSARGSPRRT